MAFEQFEVVVCFSLPTWCEEEPYSYVLPPCSEEQAARLLKLAQARRMQRVVRAMLYESRGSIDLWVRKVAPRCTCACTCGLRPPEPELPTVPELIAQMESILPPR